MIDTNGARNNEHYHRGIALYDRGLYAEAISEFERVLQSVPEDPTPERRLSSFYICEAHTHLGIAYLRSGNYRRAEQELELAILTHPEYADLHYYLGVIFYKQAKYEQAQTEFKQALDINPKYAKCLLYLGITQLQMGSDEGLRWLNQAIGIQPAYGGRKYDLAIRFYSQSQVPQACKLIEEIADLDVDHIGFMLSKAMHLMKDDHYYEASHVLLDAVGICPHYADVRHHLGICYLRLGKAGEAAQQLSKALEINPAFVSARLNLARAYSDLGKKELAEGELEHVLRLNPEDPVALDMLAKLQSKNAA